MDIQHLAQDDTGHGLDLHGVVQLQRLEGQEHPSQKGRPAGRERRQGLPGLAKPLPWEQPAQCAACHKTSCCHGLWAAKSTLRKNGSCVAAPCLGPVTRKWRAPQALEHGTGISAGQAGVQNRAQQPWLVPRVRTGDTRAWPQQCHPSPVQRHRAHLASRHEHQARPVSHHSQLQNDQPTT